MQGRTTPIDRVEDLSDVVRGTPIEGLVRSHNFGEAIEVPAEPRLVVLTCMDFRISLRHPDLFAFVVRTAGATVTPVLFNMTVPFAAWPIEAIAIIGHEQCAMCNVSRLRADYLRRFPGREDLFDQGCATFECEHAPTNTLRQCEILRSVAPDLLIHPLHYDVETHRLLEVHAA